MEEKDNDWKRLNSVLFLMSMVLTATGMIWLVITFINFLFGHGFNHTCWFFIIFGIVGFIVNFILFTRNGGTLDD